MTGTEPLWVNPKRVVIDTNVLVSALVFQQSSLAWLLPAWLFDVICPVVSDDTAEGLRGVISYSKFKLSDERRDKLLRDYLPWCEVATVSESTVVPECRDPRDVPFLKLAAAAKVDALITGDKDLLVLADAFPVPIMTPAAFKEQLGIIPPQKGE